MLTESPPSNRINMVDVFWISWQKSSSSFIRWIITCPLNFVFCYNYYLRCSPNVLRNYCIFQNNFLSCCSNLSLLDFMLLFNIDSLGLLNISFELMPCQTLPIFGNGCAFGFVTVISKRLRCKNFSAVNVQFSVSSLKLNLIVSRIKCIRIYLDLTVV